MVVGANVLPATDIDRDAFHSDELGLALWAYYNSRGCFVGMHAAASAADELGWNMSMRCCSGLHGCITNCSIDFVHFVSAVDKMYLDWCLLLDQTLCLTRMSV